MILWLVTSVGIALVALTPLAVISLVVILARRRSRTWQGAALPVIQFMALPAAIVAALAFALRPGDIEPGDTFALNWEPFRDLRMSVESGHLVSIAVQNLAGNAAMFLPDRTCRTVERPARSVAYFGIEVAKPGGAVAEVSVRFGPVLTGCRDITSVIRYADGSRSEQVARVCATGG